MAETVLNRIISERVAVSLKKRAQNTTCKTCGRGAYEGLNEDGEDAIICSNCDLEENECTCKRSKGWG